MDTMNVSHQPPSPRSSCAGSNTFTNSSTSIRGPRRTGAVAMALAMLDRELPMSSRQIASFARMGHETVRRGPAR